MMFKGIIVTSYEPGMKSEKPCALHKICGKELLGRAMETLKKAGANKWDVVSSEDDAARERNTESGIEEIFALRVGAIVSSDIIKSAVEYHEKSGNELTAVICDGVLVGAVLRDRDFYYDLEDCVNGFDGKKGEYVSSEECVIVKDRKTLAKAEKLVRERIIERHMENGVTFHFPESVYIEDDVEIGTDTEIYGNTEILQGTKIGKNCIVGTGSRLEGAVIGDNVEILSSVVLKSKISDGVHIGPFAYVRPNCCVGKNVKVGDFVEIKNSVIDDGTKISHLTYIGDSDVGKNVNFGCGTVTCNYDGKNKFRSKIGDNSFVGCNTNLVSPVEVGERAYIAAGSTITGDIPEGSLSIARARQVNKEGWADEHKKY